MDVVNFSLLPLSGHGKPQTRSGPCAGGTQTDALRLYARDYRLFVVCEKRECGNWRELLYAILECLFEPDQTLGAIASRFRCQRRGRIKTEYIGPTSDGR
jgi:hypothetical protein